LICEQREATAGRTPRWFGLKFFNVFGPNEYHKADMMSLVAKNYRRIAAGEPIRLFKSHRPGYADGEQCRDFIYVKDCAAVMLWLLRSAMGSGIFNVGSGHAHNFRELMEAVGLACGVAPDNRICGDATSHPTKLSVFH
jgi:ADP-L-glycero-D-manno-heptose 6-epimerase